MRHIICLLIVVSISLFCFSSVKAFAHEKVVIGNITIEAGWVTEPPLINTFNHIQLSVFDNDNPVRNAMNDLSTSIHYGGLQKILDFVPSQESAGVYVSDIIPTQLGTYTIAINGRLNSENIQAELKIEDVEDIKKIAFPLVETEIPSSSNDINRQIKPMMNDIISQLDDSKIKINSTGELVQKSIDRVEVMQTDIEKISLLAFIATGLALSAIALNAFRQKYK